LDYEHELVFVLNLLNFACEHDYVQFETSYIVELIVRIKATFNSGKFVLKSVVLLMSENIVILNCSNLNLIYY